MKRSIQALTLLVLGGIAALPGIAAAQQQGDYGDAPEGVLAYPSTGIGGVFPTCVGGPSGFIYHGVQPNLLYLGPSVDFEFDGNASFCPQPPYDQDECDITGGDAGLRFPDPYTISAGLEVTCNGLPAQSLGQTCKIANWGVDIEIDVVNNQQQTAFFNLLIDWDMNGAWGGASACGANAVPEWVVTNMPIPPFYVGPLSGLFPPNFQIGPKDGFAWMRATISDAGVLAPWDGSGFFELGESEDYLIAIDKDPGNGLEYGDAPENAPAYPSAGVIGAFPTCLAGPVGFVSHQSSGNLYFGASVDLEFDGNAGFCPQPPHNQDECAVAGGDAGLMTPDPYTIQAGAEVPCPGVLGTPLGRMCALIDWGPDIDIFVNNFLPNDVFFNLLIDWNRDGAWAGSSVVCGAIVATEHVVANFVIPGGFVGPISALGNPQFVAAAADFVWSRFTLSDTPVASGWDGTGQFDDGETEDYLLLLREIDTSVPGTRVEQSSWTEVKELFR